MHDSPGIQVAITEAAERHRLLHFYETDLPELRPGDKALCGYVRPADAGDADAATKRCAVCETLSGDEWLT